MIDLNQLKLALKLNDDEDDDELQRKLTSAIYECANYLNVPYDPSKPTEGTPFDKPDVINGIVLMVMSDFDVEVFKRNQVRDCAINLWTPYRVSMGI